ncbi:AMP-binding protein [Streptomyces albus]|uniref:AMP-binding protein n=1 Tax=Streptomyces albus TaxID=1888 RepID=UPI0024ADE367|nr:AMP-binding protein [Streptomyces albus]MDI6408811.1 AMP-binding protein [Streptomyces albus]
MRDVVARLRPPQAAARRYRAQGWWREETFADDLRTVAAEEPDRTALVSRRHLDGSVVTLTFRELARAARRVSRGLRTLGVRPGQVVAYQLPDRWETVAFVLGCIEAGAVTVPVLDGESPAELERVLEATGASVCAVGDAGAARALARCGGRLPSLAHRIVLGARDGDGRTDGPAAGGDGGALDFHHALLSATPGDREDPPTPLPPDAPALIAFTSGTTGRAKGVLHSGNTLYAAVTGARDCASREPAGGVVATTAPLSNLVGVRHAVLEPLVHRSTTVFLDSWDPAALVELAAQHRVDCLLTRPADLRRLLHHSPDRPTASLETVVCTGSPLPADLVEAVERGWGVRVRNAWGMTETGGALSTAPDDPDGWAARSVGRPWPSVEVRLREAGEAEPGTSQLAVRGPGVCLAVLDPARGQVTWCPDDTDGWFDTGDLVRDDGRGGLRLVGRRSERVLSAAGFMVPVVDVENVLREHPDIDDAVLVGCPDAAHGEVPRAVVVAQGRAPSLENVRDFLSGRQVPDWHQPLCLGTVPRLPRNGMGKVARNRLREALSCPAGAHGTAH